MNVLSKTYINSTGEPLHRGHHWTQLAVLYREVSLIQRKICIQLYVVGLQTVSPLKGTSFRVSFIERFPGMRGALELLYNSQQIHMLYQQIMHKRHHMYIHLTNTVWSLLLLQYVTISM